MGVRFSQVEKPPMNDQFRVLVVSASGSKALFAQGRLIFLTNKHL